MEVFFFPNGNTAVVGDGSQVPELQQPWILLYAQFLESKGIDPTGVTLSLPSGRKARFFRISDGLNWEFVNVL